MTTLAAVGIMSPGPDFVVVSYTAMTGAHRRAGWVASGVVPGNAAWAAAAVFYASVLTAASRCRYAVTVKALCDAMSGHDT